MARSRNAASSWRAMFSFLASINKRAPSARHCSFFSASMASARTLSSASRPSFHSASIFYRSRDFIYIPFNIRIIQTYVDFTISPFGNKRTQFLHGNNSHDTKRQTAVVFVLHDVDFLGAEIGDQTHAECVGAGDTSLVIKELEPFLWNKAQTHLAGMFGTLTALNSSASWLSSGSSSRTASHQSQWALGYKTSETGLVTSNSLHLIICQKINFDIPYANCARDYINHDGRIRGAVTIFTVVVWIHWQPICENKPQIYTLELTSIAFLRLPVRSAALENIFVIMFQPIYATELTFGCSPTLKFTIKHEPKTIAYIDYKQKSINVQSSVQRCQMREPKNTKFITHLLHGIFGFPFMIFLSQPLFKFLARLSFISRQQVTNMFTKILINII